MPRRQAVVVLREAEAGWVEQEVPADYVAVLAVTAGCMVLVVAATNGAPFAAQERIPAADGAPLAVERCTVAKSPD